MERQWETLLGVRWRRGTPGHPRCCWIAQLYIFVTGGDADGGTGNDFVRSRFGALSRGGAGDDIAIALDGGTTDGGSGDDIVRGAEAAALFGGSGNDRVESTSGDPTIDCGSGTDTVVEDADPSGRGCERAATFP